MDHLRLLISLINCVSQSLTGLYIQGELEVFTFDGKTFGVPNL